MQLPDAEATFRELAEKVRGAVTRETALVGIHTGGAWLAERLREDLGLSGPLGTLDVSFYRDDFDKIGLHRDVKRTAIPFDVAGRDILLVDDVLYTGRTIRAALNELFDYGRPARVRLAALIDRGGRELPIAAEFIGAEVALAPGQSVELLKDAKGKLSLQLHHD
ncbi:MAG: bifunctional pyr operon transcriptional regulator/uracil phosphoribosyltransferase PyrR [Betaproteobacteria bacterium]|nr:bifunctional pyr operon transcriptional regulator/uracil phosphoribosyltransferase PyrR [Betaproteobacteria bacterium]